MTMSSKISVFAVTVLWTLALQSCGRLSLSGALPSTVATSVVAWHSVATHGPWALLGTAEGLLKIENENFTEPRNLSAGLTVQATLNRALDESTLNRVKYYGCQIQGGIVSSMTIAAPTFTLDDSKSVLRMTFLALPSAGKIVVDLGDMKDIAKLNLNPVGARVKFGILNGDINGNGLTEFSNAASPSDPATDYELNEQFTLSNPSAPNNKVDVYSSAHLRLDLNLDGRIILNDQNPIATNDGVSLATVNYPSASDPDNCQ